MTQTQDLRLMTGSSPQRWRLPEEYLTLYSTWLWLKNNSHKQDLKLGPKHFIQQVFKLQMEGLSSMGHWLNHHCVVYNNSHDNLLQFNYITLNHRFSPLSLTGENIKQIFDFKKQNNNFSFIQWGLVTLSPPCAAFACRVQPSRLAGAMGRVAHLLGIKQSMLPCSVFF